MASGSGDYASKHFGSLPIQLLAAQVGIEGFDKETAEELSVEVEFRLRQIIQVAAKFMRHSNRDVMSTEDVDCALRLWNVESLYGYSSQDPITFQKAEGYDDLFFIKDNEVSFQSLIEEEIPKCPPEPTFSIHWLAVEGQQPNVPQNPAYEHPLDITDEGDDGNENEVKEAEKHHIKQTVKHVLSKEQQMYYERVTDAIKSSNQALHHRILHSLANDPGLHQLLPYLVQFIADEVIHNLKELRLLLSLMRMADALITSRHLTIEPYLHQLMPPIMTCLVGRHLCKYAYENHWALRDYTARLIKTVCNRFGKTYPDLQPRVTRQLLNAFIDPTKPLTTHYGAIVGLAVMGDEVVEVTLLKHMRQYLNLLRPVLNPSIETKERGKGEGGAAANPQNMPNTTVSNGAGGGVNVGERRLAMQHRRRLLMKQSAVRLLEARRCYGALLEAVGSLVRQKVYAIEYSKLLEAFAKTLTSTRDRRRTGKTPSYPRRRRKKEKLRKRKQNRDNGSNGGVKRPRVQQAPSDGVPNTTANGSDKKNDSSTNASEEGDRKNGNSGPSQNDNEVDDDDEDEECSSSSSSSGNLTWKHLFNMFGERILPYRIHLVDGDNQGVPSIGSLLI